MFIVHIDAGGVKGVQLQAPTEFFEDFDLAVWPLVRKDLNRLDKRLKRAARKTLVLMEGEDK